MLTYTTLKDRPREFLAATGLTHAEFVLLLPAFAAAYAAFYPLDKTWQGKVRQRQVGGGAKGILSQLEDKLLFILVYQKTNPLQTMHGLQFNLSQPQSNYWIHRLLPVLQRALAALDMAPERDASRVATSPLTLEGAPAGALDGTERRRQRKPIRIRTCSWSMNTPAKWSIWGPPWPGKCTTRKRPTRPRLPTRSTPHSTRTRAFRAMSRRAS